ncbi:MAG: radical SAM protein [Bacteroidales bacterium]|jgi:radical SAM enzyme (TIGR01210 family)|nr:radical SAM protein [Bacteroidales bacterium]
MRHYNIPIFIPQQACFNSCIYCNQHHISGQFIQPSSSEIISKIETYLQTFKEPYNSELAFFGGSFTAINQKKQEEYLQIIQPYIYQNKIRSIRISTRPDYITPEILQMLKKYNVQTIELGAQSLNDEVLEKSQRGHSVKDVQNASKLINEYGFDLGLQMMIGLPHDTLEKSIETAKEIVRLGAKSTRIYPTLVIENTILAELFRKGDYLPLEMGEAIIWTSKLYNIFLENNVNILRVGLHPSEALISGKELLAGPFHVSFRELVLSNIWKEKFESITHKKANVITIYVNPKYIGSAVGYKSQNKIYLQKYYKNVIFRGDTNLIDFQFNYISL